MLRYMIDNDDDLRAAYMLLRRIENDLADTDDVLCLKYKIREYVSRPASERLIVRKNKLIVRSKLPDWISKLDEAYVYFDMCEKIEYDSAGRIFSGWWRIVERHGKFYAYHRICNSRWDD